MKFFLALLALVTASLAWTEQVEINHIEKANLKTGTGVGFGYADPMGGFVYRQHFDDRLGFRVLGGGWGSDGYGWVGFNFGGMYSFFYHEFRLGSLQEASTRLFGLGTFSTSYTYMRDQVQKERHTIEPGLGAGIGMDLQFSKHLAASIEVPFQISFHWNRTGFFFHKANPAIGAALIYYF